MELLQLDQERTRLTSAIQIAKARINRMLHRAPDAPLPPPPAELGTFVVHHRRHDGSDAHPLERSSPQLQQMSEELQASVVNEELATLGFWPDFSVETTYSTMFEALPHQWMVGASITLPVQWDAKSARLDAARARIRQTMAREQQLHAKLATEVAEAHVVVDSSTKLMETFESRLLPTARAQVSAAQIAFETGSADLREWVEAENERRSLELARDQAQAASFRASARLRRVVGEFASDERARP
jgi:cobalt-zinc-cadmium efflux system outer membrane protein